MINLLSQGQSCTTPRQCLVWIPEYPQDVRQMKETEDPEIYSHKSNGRATLLRVGKGQGVLTVGASRAQLPQRVQDRPQPKVCDREESRVVCALGQRDESLCQLTRGL